MKDVLSLILPIAAAIAVYMTAWFAFALAKKDNSVADVAWGLGFALAAAATLVRSGEGAPRQVIATAFVVLWGGRLAVHIFVRNRKKGEDPRYADWRAKWGRSFVLRSYLQVFLLQGFFMLLIMSPVVLINGSSGAARRPLGALGAAAAAVWAAGFMFEAVGDAQLSRFKRDPSNRGRIMDRGLWKYTRHPNYFGESLMWWGLFLLALPLPGGWLTALSPLVITFLLVRVSGIPLLERRYAGNAEFQAYARRTSAFIPWMPKR